MNVQGVIGTILAFGVAWLAWMVSPRLIALIGLGDLEFLARAGIVVLSLGLLETIAARLRVSALLPPEPRH